MPQITCEHPRCDEAMHHADDIQHCSTCKGSFCFDHASGLECWTCQDKRERAEDAFGMSCTPVTYAELQKLEAIASGPFSALQPLTACAANGWMSGYPVQIRPGSGLSSARCPIDYSISVLIAHALSFVTRYNRITRLGKAA